MTKSVDVTLVWDGGSETMLVANAVAFPRVSIFEWITVTLKQATH
jgi:hypothetical protein